MEVRGTRGIASGCRGSSVGGPGTHIEPRQPVERYATRQGNVIQLHPTEVTFEVPEGWRGAKTSFRLTREDLRKASREGLGLQIADGALELRDCAAQIEPDNLRWLRAYVVDAPEEEILKRIREKGWRAAERIPNYVRGHSGFQTVPAKEGPWMHVDIPYTLDFGDYNGQGYASFYLQAVGGRELVIVMGAFWAGEVYKPTDERQNVLKSVVAGGGLGLREQPAVGVFAPESRVHSQGRDPFSLRREGGKVVGDSLRRRADVYLSVWTSFLRKFEVG